MTFDWTTRVTKNSKKTITNRVNVFQYKNGYKVVTKDGFNDTIVSWDLEIAPLSQTELATLMTQIIDVQYSNPFNYTDLSGLSTKWRILPDSKKLVLLSRTEFAFYVTIEQAFIL